MSSPSEQFSLIYDQYIEKIYRFVYVKIGSREATEDITSRVFTKGWEYYQKDQKIENIGALLYQIARTSVVDHYRHADRTKTVSTDHIAQLSDGKSDIHEQVILAADIEALRVALGNVQKDYQDVLILHYLEDMSA